MGLTWSSPLETHLTVTGFLHSNFMSFWPFGFSVHFSPMASFVPKAKPIRLLFFGTGITFSRPFLFRAFLKN